MSKKEFVDYIGRKEFLDYIEGQLIPDLKEANKMEQPMIWKYC